MWDYVPTETYLCRTRGCIRAVREDHKPSIAWTRVHAIINQGTCLKIRSKWGDQRLTWQHVELSGVSDLHQTGEKASSASDRYRTNVILSRLETRRGRSRSFTIRSTAWTVAIFRNRRHGVDALQSSDFHQKATIFISPWRCGGLSGALDLHRMAATKQSSRSRLDLIPIVA